MIKNSSGRKNRFFTAILTVALLFSFSLFSYAAEGEVKINGETTVTENTETDEDITQPPSQEDEKDRFLIVAADALGESIKKQSFVAYSGKMPLLPKSVRVTTETGEKAEVAVQWKADKTFNKNQAGIYTFTPTPDSAYRLKEGVNLPVITVKIEKCAAKITCVVENYTRKSRGTICNTVYVSNGVGRTLKLQMLKDGKWVTEKEFRLTNAKTQGVAVKFTDSWWTVTSSQWRMCIDADKGAEGYVTGTINIKTLRYYQNPSKYIQIQDEIKIDNSGAYTLKKGYMGLKVRQVNRYFGIGDKYWPRYTSATKSRVKAFQRKKGLKATGNVDRKTWLKMGFSESSWKNLGAYVSPVRVNPSSTKKQHIEAMIDRAYDYLGSDYVVGASGTPKQGADCSGLVMQSLYAAGVEIPKINPVTHSYAGHEFESRNMWNCKKFKKVKYKNKKRGDLIFYKGPSGYVNHIAIYLGNGKVIESWPNRVRIARVNHQAIKGVRRVFV